MDARACVAAAAAVWLAAPAAAQPLPVLRTDPAMTSVSGLSSGGYMAVQLHVAHSRVFRQGAAAVAAGPWLCAQGSPSRATGPCLTGEPAIPVDALQALARQAAAAGRLDPLSNLSASRLYLFSGTRDSAVRPVVTDALRRWYEPFVPAAATRHRRDIPAEHGMVTDDFGNACSTRGRPYIQNCGVDVAGDLLAHLFASRGELKPRNDGALQGRFLRFDQRDFVAAGRGMAEQGHAYVPRDCEAPAAGGCAVHVVLHGCGQNEASLGEDYVRRTGYPRWADTNRIVLLFPQTGGDEAVNACWDWWGYTGPGYALRGAPQMAAIVAMVERLSGAARRCVTAFNGTHAWAGRAVAGLWGRVAARGTGAALGWPWQRSTLEETAPGHFVRLENCA